MSFLGSSCIPLGPPSGCAWSAMIDACCGWFVGLKLDRGGLSVHLVDHTTLGLAEKNTVVSTLKIQRRAMLECRFRGASWPPEHLSLAPTRDRDRIGWKAVEDGARAGGATVIILCSRLVFSKSIYMGFGEGNGRLICTIFLFHQLQDNCVLWVGNLGFGLLQPVVAYCYAILQYQIRTRRYLIINIAVVVTICIC